MPVIKGRHAWRPFILNMCIYSIYCIFATCIIHIHSIIYEHHRIDIKILINAHTYENRQIFMARASV
jgi:hypothetical protein